MKITCGSCSVVLNLPDEQIPKNVPQATATCPNCRNPVVIKFGQEAPPQATAAETPAAPPAASEPPPAAPPQDPPSRQEDIPAPEPEPEPEPEEDFGEIEDIPDDARLALVCLKDQTSAEAAKSALEKLDYLVHIPERPGQGVFWLRRYKYRLVLVHEEYGGAQSGNAVMRYLAPLEMSIRRDICVGLVGKFKSLDNMAAFARSVNFTVHEEDLGKIEDLSRQAVVDNDNFFAPFKEALKAAGKA